MRVKSIRLFLLLTLLAFSLILVACDSGSQEDEPASTSDQEGALAIVESVSVEETSAHKYAVVTGRYPDACTKISGIDQVVEGNSFNITLYTDKPAELVCAQMISPFSVSILLKVGGKTPGDYTININDSVSTTFTLGG